MVVPTPLPRWVLLAGGVLFFAGIPAVGCLNAAWLALALFALRTFSRILSARIEEEVQERINRLRIEAMALEREHEERYGSLPPGASRG